MPRDDAKSRILLAARERMLRVGYTRLSVDDLVSDLGMSKKTFYRIFRSKEDLLVQIIDRTFAEVRLGFNRIMRSDTDFVRKLTAIVSFIGDQVARIGRPLQEDMQKVLPHHWHRIEQFRREQFTRTFSTLMDQGIAEGYIRDDVNKRVFLLAYLGGIQSTIVPAVLVRESFSAQEALRCIVGIFFQGILTEDARQEFTQMPAVNNTSLL